MTMQQLNQPVRLVIYGAFPVLAEGLGAVLARTPGLAIMDLPAAVALHERRTLLRQFPPDILILIGLPQGPDTLQLVRQHLATFPKLVVLVLSDRHDRATLSQVFHRRISGYVSIRATVPEIVASIQAVAAAADPTGPTGQLRPEVPRELLTRREREILQLLGGGYSNAELAETIGLSRKTIEFHVSRLLVKLQCRSRTQLVLTAQRQGFLANPPGGTPLTVPPELPLLDAFQT